MMRKLGTGQDRILSQNFVPVDSAEDSREQTKLPDKRDIAVGHDQVSDFKYMCGESEDKLRGLSATNTPASTDMQYKGTYRFEKNLR